MNIDDILLITSAIFSSLLLFTSTKIVARRRNNTDIDRDYLEKIKEAFLERDVEKGIHLLARLKEYCLSGGDAEVCDGLSEAEALFEITSKINELLARGMDSSHPLPERLRVLEEAIGLCSRYNINCRDVESVLKDVKSYLRDLSDRICTSVRFARSLLDEGRIQEAWNNVSEALRICNEAGVSDYVKECDRVREVEAFIVSVKRILESSIVVGVVNSAVTEGTPVKLRVVAQAPRVEGFKELSILEGIYVDFSEATNAGLNINPVKVVLPRITVGSTAEAVVEAVPARAGVLEVPWRACFGDLCVSRSLTLEVIPTPPKPVVIPEPVVSVSLADVHEVLGEGFPNLVGGYGCVESYSPRVVEFSGWLVPGGFEGSWECCLLGSGGWGSTYLCRRKGGSVSSVPSEAVFKVPRGFEGLIEGGYVPTVSERLLRRVAAEAEVLGGLKHPNILRLYSVSERVPVLVYEFGDGGSVEWQLSRGWEPSLRDVLLLGVQVGDALRYIHSRGLVHGDVKPGNVFFVGGVAKVGDFSTLTRLVARTSTHSRFGYTPGFRAPEQAYSDLRRKAIELGLESRMDVYMLGNLILHVLTGDSIDGEDAVRPGVVDEVVEGVEDPGLRALLRRMLDPEPARRPSSEEVVVKLLKLLKGV